MGKPTLKNRLSIIAEWIFATARKQQFLNKYCSGAGNAREHGSHDMPSGGSVFNLSERVK